MSMFLHFNSVTFPNLQQNNLQNFLFCGMFNTDARSLLFFVSLCLVIISEWPPFSHRLLWFWWIKARPHWVTATATATASLQVFIWIGFSTATETQHFLPFMNGLNESKWRSIAIAINRHVNTSICFHLTHLWKEINIEFPLPLPPQCERTLKC